MLYLFIVRQPVIVVVVNSQFKDPPASERGHYGVVHRQHVTQCCIYL
jgi:hypothetical protein